MDETELREWLAANLKQPVDDEMWRLLREDGYVNVLDEAEQQDLLRRARKLLQFRGARPKKRRAKRQASSGESAVRSQLTQTERNRAAALSECLAHDARTEDQVRRFRANFIDGRCLSAEEAMRFLGSDAARMFSASQFASSGVPIIGHDASLISEEGEYPRNYRAVVRVTPPGVEWTHDVVLPLGGGTWLSNDRCMGTDSIVVRGDDRHRFAVNYWPGSLIGDLHRTAKVLEHRRFPWKDGEAAWFVLTGRTPAVNPLAATVNWQMGTSFSRTTLTLTIDPWVSANSVVKTYRSFQRSLLGRHNRPISERRLSLVRFVVDQSDDEGKLPPWRTLMEKWNHRQKAWRYKDVRNMSRDYWSAVRQVVLPDVKLPI